MTDFTVGDRIKVFYHGEVTAVRDNSIFVDVDDKPGNSICVRYQDIIGVNPDGGSLNVTVTEKAVEIFGPGSVVKHRTSGNVYTILESGYFIHRNAQVGLIGVTFTSEFYERIA